MKKIILFSFFVLTSNAAYSVDGFPFPMVHPKGKAGYKFSKCINGATYYRQDLTFDEVCKYGKKCPDKNTGKKFTVYCMEKKLSECFENKAWRTANELVHLPKRIKIGLITQGLSFRSGASPNKTCAYYD